MLTPTPNSRSLRNTALGAALVGALLMPVSIAYADDFVEAPVEAITADAAAPAAAALDPAAEAPIIEPVAAPTEAATEADVEAVVESAGEVGGETPEHFGALPIIEPDAPGDDTTSAATEPADAIVDPASATDQEEPGFATDPAETTGVGASANLLPQQPGMSALIPEREIFGSVQDVAGNPLANATVYVRNSTVQQPLTTAADGRFATTALPVGTYNYEAIVSGLPSVTGSFTLTLNGSSELGIVVGEYSVLSGTLVSDPTNTPIAGASVYVDYEERPFGYAAVTDANGFWELPAVEPGRVTVRFEGPAGSDFQTEWYSHAFTRADAQVLTLELGGTTLDLAAGLYSGGGTIGGEVQLLNGNAPSSAWIKVYDAAGDNVASALVGADGRYSTSGLAVGVYTVVASGSDGTQYRRSAPATVEIDSAGEHEVPPLVLLYSTKEDLPAPVAVDDTYSTSVDTLLQVGVPGLLANDTPSKPQNHELQLDEIVVEPLYGDLIATTNGSFVYLPDDGFAGVDTFQYTVRDFGVGEAPATVTIHVGGLDGGDGSGSGDGSDDGSDDGAGDPETDAPSTGNATTGNTGSSNASGDSAGPSEMSTSGASSAGALASTGASELPLGWLAALGLALATAGSVLFTGRRKRA